MKQRCNYPHALIESIALLPPILRLIQCLIRMLEQLSGIISVPTEGDTHTD